ncbi:hypothetical protein EXIGLDRAFT_137418 [Exidia glandulosa HHB12029]|uniref:Uncharacterized protein n=1 Tax=Exidia glandulosa HHB12029 TaxID=1314781 RepID=A0A165G0M0_EXIGL|nr:hypothetical protein EXIGLDRAFT_137418 [Exidia glandulosa HHB12029]
MSRLARRLVGLDCAGTVLSCLRALGFGLAWAVAEVGLALPATVLTCSERTRLRPEPDVEPDDELAVDICGDKVKRRNRVTWNKKTIDGRATRRPRTVVLCSGGGVITPIAAVLGVCWSWVLFVRMWRPEPGRRRPLPFVVVLDNELRVGRLRSGVFSSCSGGGAIEGAAATASRLVTG